MEENAFFVAMTETGEVDPKYYKSAVEAEEAAEILSKDKDERVFVLKAIKVCVTNVTWSDLP